MDKEGNEIEMVEIDEMDESQIGKVLESKGFVKFK
jgi:hypothetical protein